MATNFYFQSGIPGGRVGEQRLMEDLIIESIKIYGFDLYYLPRTEVNPDSLFEDDTIARFENAIPLEAYLENVDGFGGDGELMSKFGIEIRDTANFVVSRSRWADVVGAGRSSYLPLPNRPSEGDLLYFPMTRSYFEIKKVETHDPFYQLGKLYVYKLQCELWQYSSEELNTDIEEIDQLEDKLSQSVSSYEFRLESGDRMILDSNDYNATDAGYLMVEGWSQPAQDPLADNDTFNLDAQGILDFTEINPFGEVIRNNV